MTKEIEEWENEFNKKFPPAQSFPEAFTLDFERSTTNREKIKSFIHHQLQKARALCLRSEIETLEGMKSNSISETIANTEGAFEPTELEMMEEHAHNQALDYIITRYKEELLELDKTNGL